MSNKFNNKKLDIELEKIRELISKRKEIFEERPEKWKESDIKGEIYEMRTQKLVVIADDLENVIDSLQSWNNDNN